MGEVGHARDRAVHKIDAIAQGFVAIGKAAEVAAERMGNLFTIFPGRIPGVIMARDERDGSVILAVDPALPYPTRSGVEDGREALSASERVDAAAARMGVELTPWQRELAIATVSGVPMMTARGKSGGKTAVSEVVQEAHMRGVEAKYGWIDEATRLS